MLSIIFSIFSITAIMGALGLILFKHPMNGALSLIVTMLSIAGFYALLHAEVIFIFQILVYAGAIMVLSVFIIMYVNIREKELFISLREGLKAIFGILCFSPILFVLMKGLEAKKAVKADLEYSFGDINVLGLSIFNNWVLPFELISILLTICVLSVIVIAKTKDA